MVRRRSHRSSLFLGVPVLKRFVVRNNGSLYNISHAAKYVDSSVCDVVPKGSTWARNPIPRIHTDNDGMAFVGSCVLPAYTGTIADCQQFPTPCPELAGATPANGMMGEWYKSNGHNQSAASDRNTHEGACSGDWTLGMISDELVLPPGIKAGNCEQPHPRKGRAWNPTITSAITSSTSPPS